MLLLNFRSFYETFRILDPFTITLITVVLLASFFPAEGGFVPFFEGLTTAAIALLFFMHGAKLSREAIIAGGSHWRLHLWVMCSTFVVFPVLGVLFAWWAPVNVDPMLYTGFLYLCILPATVQSAIAFTSLAGVMLPPPCVPLRPPACWVFFSRRCWLAWS